MWQTISTAIGKQPKRLSKPDRTVPHKGHSANAKGGFQDLFRCGTKAAEPGDRKAGCADGTADDYPPDAGDADIRYPDPDAGLPVGTERRDYWQECMPLLLPLQTMG